MKKKVFSGDLDNVLCKTIKDNYKNSKPIKKNIKIVNELFHKTAYYQDIYSKIYV